MHNVKLKVENRLTAHGGVFLPGVYSKRCIGIDKCGLCLRVCPFQVLAGINHHGRKSVPGLQH